MTDSKRQQLISALDTRLKTVLASGGYETDLGQNVQWYRQEPFAETESGISCEDTESAPEWIGAGVQLRRLSVEIRIAMPAGVAMADLRKGIADVVKAVGTDLTFGGLAEDCILGEVPSEVEEASARAGGAIVNLVVEYTTEPWNPYQ